MSELLEGFSTDDVEQDAAFETGDAAVSLALERVRGRPDTAADQTVDRFLDDQRGLIADQRHHLHEQLKHLKIRRFSEALRILIQLLTIAVGATVAIALAVTAYNVSRDHSLVIEPAGVPGDLAQQGWTGPALATALEDKLAGLQDATASPLRHAAVHGGAISDIRVEIPATGVSVGEAERLLNDWFGHQTHVSSELSHVTAGPDKGALALSVRVDGHPGVRLLQADGDLEPLLQRAAEAVYGATQPMRYATWLTQHDRTADAAGLLRRVAADGDNGQRAQALSLLAFVLSVSQSDEVQRALYAAALPLQQGSGSATVNIAGPDVRLGRWELARREAAGAVQAPPPDGSSPEGQKAWRITAAALAGELVGDYGPDLAFACYDFRAAPCAADAVASVGGLDLGARRRDLIIDERLARFATAFVRAHDLPAAAALLRTPHPPEPGRFAAYNDSVAAGWLRTAAELHAAQGDWPAVLRDTEGWDALAAKWPGLRYPASPDLLRAMALARTGDAAGAERLLAATPADCYPCLVMRGRVAAVRGDLRAAQAWLAQARRLGPSLPFADAAWGELLLAQGDAAAAQPHLAEANRLSPKWADPLALWGEALLRSGDPRGAADKLARAADLAPRWSRPRQAWAQALDRLGRSEAAKVQRAAAARLAAAERPS